MSIYNFSRDQYVRIFGEDEVVKISTHGLPSCELGNMRVRVYSKGTNTGAKIKLIIFPKDNTSTSVATSDEVLITDLGTNFLGFVRFDFSKENISIGEYDIYAKISSYTRNGDVDFFSLLYDFPIQIYSDGTDFLLTPIAIEDFIYS